MKYFFAPPYPVVKLSDVPGFRYRGGKCTLRKFIARWCPLEGNVYVEPFVGRANMMFLMRHLAKFKFWVINDIQTIPFFESIKDYDGSPIVWPTEEEFRARMEAGDHSLMYMEPALFWSGGTAKTTTGSMTTFTGNLYYTEENYRQTLLSIQDLLKDIIMQDADAIDVIRSYGKDKDSFIYCLHPNQKIRMEDEKQKKIINLEKGDVLAGGKTVKNVFVKKSKGELLNLKIQGMMENVKATPDHKFVRIPGRLSGRQDKRNDDDLWNAKETVKAEQLNDGDYVLIPIGGKETEVKWSNDDLATVRQPSKRGIFLNNCESLWRLLGYFAAEGHTLKSNDTPCGSYFSFCWDEENTYAQDAIKCCEESFGITPKTAFVGPDDCVFQVRINSMQIAGFISEKIQGLQPERKLSQDIMTAPLKLQRELLIGWLRGDGSLEVSSKNRVRLLGTTSSKILARQMFTIAIRLGLRPSYKFRGGRTHDIYFAGEDAYKLGWEVPCKKFRCSRRIINGHILTRIRKITKEKYKGPVVDIEVDGDHLFPAPFILTHNCDPPYLNAKVGSYDDTMVSRKGMIDALKACKAKWLLSEYYCEDLVEAFGEPIHKIKFTVRAGKQHTKRKVYECLWAGNYTPKPFPVNFFPGDTPASDLSFRLLAQITRVGDLKFTYKRWKEVVPAHWTEEIVKEQFQRLCKDPYSYFDGKFLHRLKLKEDA